MYDFFFIMSIILTVDMCNGPVDVIFDKYQNLYKTVHEMEPKVLWAFVGFSFSFWDNYIKIPHLSRNLQFNPILLIVAMLDTTF